MVWLTIFVDIAVKVDADDSNNTAMFDRSGPKMLKIGGKRGKKNPEADSVATALS